MAATVAVVPPRTSRAAAERGRGAAAVHKDRGAPQAGEVQPPPRCRFMRRPALAFTGSRTWPRWSLPIIPTGACLPPPALHASDHPSLPLPPPPLRSTPEIIFLPIDGGSDAYLQWLRSTVAAAPK
jgi:hypothetical protein